jgi:hypothetical protein
MLRRSSADTAERQPMAVRKSRPIIVAVQLNEQERQELQAAATQAGLKLAVFVRALALTTIRRPGGKMHLEPAA